MRAVMHFGNEIVWLGDEPVTDKPFFREAFRRTSCLIPASGYYEWQNTATGALGPAPCVCPAQCGRNGALLHRPSDRGRFRDAAQASSNHDSFIGDSGY
jgi:hypothetical protein